MNASDPPPTASPDIGGAKYRLIQERIGRPPIEVVAEMRAEIGPRGDGPAGPASFNTIAVRLTQMSGEPLTYESVRRWWDVYQAWEEEREEARRKAQVRKAQTRKDRTAAGKPSRKRKSDGGIPPAVFSGGSDQAC